MPRQLLPGWRGCAHEHPASRSGKHQPKPPAKTLQSAKAPVFEVGWVVHGVDNELVVAAARHLTGQRRGLSRFTEGGLE